MITQFTIKLAVLLSFTAVVRSIPAPSGVIYVAAPEERGAFHVGGNGVYNYGYNTGDGIAKVEVRHKDGTVTGSYRYYDPSGRQIVRSYIADNQGFRVLGNDLPVAPDTPAIGTLNTQTLTGPVEGTREFSSPNIVTLDKTPILFQISNNGGYFTPIDYQRTNVAQPRFQSRLDTSNGYIVSQNNFVGLDTPYFYSSDDRAYDFPAGFAYNTLPVARVRPIGVKGESSKLPIVAGHFNGRNSRKSVTIEQRPTFRQEFKYPFIVGHAK